MRTCKNSESLSLTLTGVIIAIICLCQLFRGEPIYASDSNIVDPAIPKRVLILNSYHAGMHFSDDEVKGICENLPLGTEIFIEYMDTKRRNDSSYLEILAQAYHLKYTGKQFDTILSLDDDALNFLFAYADRIFPGIPVVFCGVNDFRPERLATHDRFTGVIETMDIEPSLKIGLQLYPSARQILVITDKSTTGVSNRASLERIAASGQLNIPIRFLDDGDGLDLTALLSKLKAETTPSLIYYSDFFRDKRGHTLDLETVIPQVAKAAPGPVLVHSSMYIGYGALGGKIISGYHQGATAAQLAMRIWDGEAPASLPVVADDINKITLDHQVLKRWDIDLSNISESKEFVIVNKPAPLFQGYGRYLTVALAFIVLQSALVLLLLKLLRQQRLLRVEGRQRAALLSSILESAPVPLSYAHEDGKILAVNSALTKELGYTLDDVPTVDDWMKAAHPDPEDRRKTLERWSNAGRSRVRGPQEYRLTAKDGSVHDMLVCSTRQDKFIIASFFDITKRKKQEENLFRSRAALEESRANMILALEMASMGSWELNLDTRMFTFNEQLYSLYATTLEREGGPLMTVENYASQFVHPDERTLVEAELRQAIEGEYDDRAANIEHRIVRRDGVVRDIVVRFLVFKDQEGRRYKIIGVHQDITERKQAQKELSKVNHRLETASVAGQIALWEMDPVSGRLEWSDAVDTMLGYPPQGFERTLAAWLEIIHPEDFRRVDDAFTTHLKNATPYEEEYRVRRADGAWVWWRDTGAAQLDEHGNPRSMAGACVDITERKRTEKDVLLAKEQAEAANLAKSAFLANMSHEIRTPLNGIIGMMQLLEMTSLDDEQKQFVLMTVKSANRLTRLLSDILDLSRIEAGKMTINEAAFVTQELIDSVSDLFKVTARDKGVLLECIIAPNTPLQLVGDDVRVRQILFNLVGNAVKFTKQGSVRLETSAVNRDKDSTIKVLFSVSDSGIGIPDEKLDDLFKPFVQVNNSYTRNVPGAGLGLAIVKRLVDLMDGKISVTSTVGEGTTVNVLLPFKRVEEK